MEQYVVLENRGPRMTSVLVRQRIGRCTVYRPGPPARRGRHCISLPSAAFLTVIPVRATAEKFRPSPSHIGPALVPTDWPGPKGNLMEEGRGTRAGGGRTKSWAPPDIGSAHPASRAAIVGAAAQWAARSCGRLTACFRSRGSATSAKLPYIRRLSR
jgi:hypothetical protein